MSDDYNPYSRNAANQPHASRKRSPWVWVLPLLALVLAAPLICCGGFFWIGFNVVTEPMEAAVRSLNQDPRVTAKLGQPIESGSAFGVKEYENKNNNGGATIDFTATGPEGSADVSGRMQLKDGNWSPEALTVRFGDGTELRLPEAADEPAPEPESNPQDS